MHKRTTINIWFYIVLIFAVLLSIKSCVGRNNDSDVIYNLKTSRFSSYGNRTLERAAKDSLTDLQWSCSEEPISIDGGFIYEATLSGYSEEYDLNISVGFTVKFGYTLQEHDPVPVTISIIWTKVGDIYSEDTNDISYVMDYIYGNLLPNEQPLAVPTESLQTEATQSTVENEDVLPENIQYLSCQVDDLLNELDQNALRASKTYNGQYLLLTGKIYSFSADGNSFSLTGLNDDGTQFSTLIYCMIPDSEQVDELLTANVGDKIVIKCAVTVIDQFTGYTVDTISIESVIKAEEAPIQETEQTFPTEPPVVETLTGTVLRSAGELNVRSGPGTNYGAIGRLYGGETVTIYEQQDVNGTVWGNIGYGWVSMDYIVFGTDNSMPPDVNVQATSDRRLEYVGEWVNEDSTYVMTISVNGKSASIHVIYYFSSTGRINWQMTGEFDEHNAIRYWNGIRTDNNNDVETVKYTNGEGAINLYQSQLEWHEFMEQPRGVFKTFTRAGAHTPNPPYLNNDNTSQNQPEQNNGIPQQNGGSDNTTGNTGKYYHFDSGDFEKAIIREIKVELGYRAGDELSYVNSSASLRNSVDNIYWCTGSGRYCGQTFFVTADVENVNGRLVVNEIDVKFV